MSPLLTDNAYVDAYKEWKQSLKRVSRASPYGYLLDLQRIYYTPSSHWAGITSGLMTAVRRAKQCTWMEMEVSDEQRDMTILEPYELSQTFYMQRYIYEPLLDALPQELRSINFGVVPIDRQRIQSIPIGVLPVKSVDAGVMSTPYGAPIIVVDSGLLHMLSYFAEVDAIGYRHHRVDFESYVRRRYKLIIDYGNNAAALSFPKPYEEIALNDARVILFQTITSELFVVCHELAHIVLGHIDENETMQPEMASVVDGEAECVPLPSVYMHNQEQEIAADLIGYDIYRTVVQAHALIQELTPFKGVETECFTLFQLLSMLEISTRKSTSVVSHPTAIERLRSLLGGVIAELRSDGLADEQILEHSLIREMSYHLSTAKGMAEVYPESS